MGRVYIVVWDPNKWGSTPEYTIIAVFSTREKAELRLSRFNKPDEFGIEEWDVDLGKYDK